MRNRQFQCLQYFAQNKLVQIQRIGKILYKVKMSKTFLLCMSILLVCSLSQTISTQTPIPLVLPSEQHPTLTSVFPSVDKYLRATYWYYLRAAGIVYQANVDTLKTFLFFTIYRNIVGTFLVISTWDKTDKTIQVNTFVRLGDGYEAGSGALYDPVKINPLVISLQLQPGEYMVIINEDGSIITRGVPPSKHETQTQAQKLQALMVQKGKIVDKSIRQQYWYYLRDAALTSSSYSATSQRYNYVNVYTGVVGTFLVIADYDLKAQVSAINTLVRLGDGSAIDTTIDIKDIKIKDIMDIKDIKDNKDHKDHKDNKDYKNHKDHKDNKDYKNHKDHKDNKDHKNHKDHKDNKDHKNHKDHKDNKDYKNHKDHKDHKDHQDNHNLVDCQPIILVPAVIYLVYYE